MPGQEPGSAEVQPSPAQRMIPPNFIEPVKSVEAVDGQELRLPCKVTGKPMPQISWYHNGKNIDQDEEYVITYNPDTGDISLLIVEVFPEDEGEYVCVAHNPAGDAVTRATLVVLETEEVLVRPTEPMEEETEVKVVPEAAAKKVEVAPEECLPEAAEIEEEEVKPALIERPKVVPLQEERPASPTFEIEVGYVPVEEREELPPEIEEQVVEPTKLTRPTPKMAPDEVKEAEVKPDVIERPKVVPLEETKPELPSMDIEVEAYVPVEIEEREEVPPEVEEQIVEPEKLVRPTPKVVSQEVTEAEVKPDIIERPKVVAMEEIKQELPSMDFEIEVGPVSEEREELPPEVEEQVVEPEKLVRPAPKLQPDEVKEAEVKPDVIERPKAVPLEETKPELPPMDIEVEIQMKETPEVTEELPEEVSEEVLERDVKPTKIDRPKPKPVTEEKKPELPEMEFEVGIIEERAERPEEELPEAEEEILEQTVKVQKIDRPKPKPIVEERAPDEPDFIIPSEKVPVEEKPDTGPEVTEEALVPDKVEKKVDFPELKPKDEDVGKKKARDDEERPPKKSEIHVPEQFEPVEDIESVEEIPPEFVELMQPQIVCDGDRVVLSTRVIGVPTPCITWYKGTAEITPSADFQIGYDTPTGICTLLIPEVFPEDAGEYACRAVNPFGESVTTANLLVEGEFIHLMFFFFFLAFVCLHLFHPPISAVLDTQSE